ncbi:MAG: LamG domain-containing protein, partial [Chloroflexi bacterium]|nr:LamG domain-containing protein [Chloroflexota bacterium]
HMYVGPIIPRGLTSPGFPTTTPVPIPVNPRLEPGTSASVRLRASLPGLHDEVILRGEPVTSDAAQLAGVVLEWRAVGAVSNAAGTPLSTPVAIPVTATPRATVSPTATATSTATASSTATSTATASATLTAAPSATPPPASYAGYALSFDGLTDDLMVGGAGFATPVALTGRDQWAIEAWVKPSVLSGAHAIYTENVTLADGTEGMVTGLGLQDRSVVVGIWNDTRGTEDKWAWHEALLPPTLEPAQWFHLAASYQSGAVAIVVNGISLPTTASGSQATNGPPNAIPSQTYIGRAGNVDLNSNFAGEMDEFRVWSTARTGSAISQARFQKQLGNEVGLA